jgi:hypothetical protein
MISTRSFRIITFLLLFTLVIFTRFWNITSLPPSLFSDEVDAGYQAMIFNRTGTDYYGNKLPVHFHSFSDWRTSAYIYSIAFVQKLGINPELSVRLPSAIFSIVCVYLIYLITGSFAASVLMIISPWMIHYSRTGFEVAGMLMVILAGIYFFKKFIFINKFRYLLFSIIFFCLSPYFYSTAKLFLPILLFLLIYIWRKNIFSLRFRYIILASLVGIIALTPMTFDTLRGHSGFRFSYISIFTQPHREQITDQLRYEDILLDHPGEVGVKTPLLSYLLHNKYQLIIQKFISNYVSSFSSNFLFLTGDSNIRHGFGGHGLLYLLDSIFLFIGLFYFFKKPDKLGLLFFWLLLVSPIPFSLTRDSTSAHATRLILMLPFLIYFISKGIGKRYYMFFIYFILFLNFWHYYTVHYSQASAAVWHNGMKQSILAANSFSDKNLYFSDTFEPFLPFFLFYHPYFPDNNLPVSQNLSHYQNEYFDGQKLDNKFFFGHINWTSLPLNSDYIFVVPENEYKTIPNQSSFVVLQKINKQYLSASDFYLITPVITKIE